MLTDNVFGLARGYWEAKDLHDTLTTAVKQKFNSGIVNDPNSTDDETYIVDMIRKVIGVSLETVRIVEELSGLDIGSES